MEIVLKKYWTKRDVRKALIINFIILLLLMAISAYFKTNLVTMVTPTIGDKTPIFLYNLYGPLENGFKKPMAVTVLNDRLYVSDAFNGRVVVFDYDGRYQFSFGKPGYGKTDFVFPYGLAGDGKGNFYVADMKKGAVMVFDENGKYKKLFAEKDVKEKLILNPGGLCWHENKLYVTDLGRDALLVFDAQGSLLQTIGKTGKGKGELRAPNAVAVKDKKIYVSDSGNDRVVIFDEKGKFLSYLGIKDAKSIFINPRGIGINGDVILVANNIPSHVHGFDIKKTKEIYAFGEMGPEDGNFGLPNGLFVDGRGRIYITDTANERVVVFQN